MTSGSTDNRVERVTESEILAPSARVFNEHEILVSTEAAQEERSPIYQYLSSNASCSSRVHLSHKTATRTKSFSDAS